jgi:hypothetical protein
MKCEGQSFLRCQLEYETIDLEVEKSLFNNNKKAPTKAFFREIYFCEEMVMFWGIKTVSAWSIELFHPSR